MVLCVHCACACVPASLFTHFFGTVLQTDFLLLNLTVRETLQVRLSLGRALRLSPHLLCGRTIFNTVRRCVASAGVQCCCMSRRVQSAGFSELSVGVVVVGVGVVWYDTLHQTASAGAERRRASDRRVGAESVCRQPNRR
jgi:hypothetical protein